MTMDDQYQDFKMLYQKIVLMKQKEIEWKEYVQQDTI